MLCDVYDALQDGSFAYGAKVYASRTYCINPAEDSTPHVWIMETDEHLEVHRWHSLGELGMLRLWFMRSSVCCAWSWPASLFVLFNLFEALCEVEDNLQLPDIFRYSELSIRTTTTRIPQNLKIEHDLMCAGKRG